MHVAIQEKRGACFIFLTEIET